MSIESIRLECYIAADVAFRKRPGIKKPVREIADGFAMFCGDSDLRLDALKMAIAEVNPRASLDEVIVVAHKFVDFAQEKPAKKPVHPVPIVSRGRGKGRSR